MYSKLISILLLSLAISSPVSATSEQPTVSEQPSAQQLPNGNGWQVIRSLEMGKSNKYVHMVLIDQDKYTDKTVYSSAIYRLCKKEKEFCRIRFWSQKRFIPEKISVTPAQFKELKAQYTFNHKAGLRQLLWSCSVDPDKSHCLEL